MNNFPGLIFEKISYYLWRLTIKRLNEEYSLRYFQTHTGSIKYFFKIGMFQFSNQYNHRNLESKNKNWTYGYFYEDQIEFNPCSPYLRVPYSIRIYNRKCQRGPIYLPPRYFFSMDPPEDIIRRYESQKLNFISPAKKIEKS